MTAAAAALLEFDMKSNKKQLNQLTITDIYLTKHTHTNTRIHMLYVYKLSSRSPKNETSKTTNEN